MIEGKAFYEYLVSRQFDFFAGVPDSLLKELCSCLRDDCPADRHIITANEGNAVAMAGGYHLSSGNYGVVYMQNSGLGNAINPLLSLMDQAVYGIPMLLLIGWRGEPGSPDEPQHRKQGEVTLAMLESMGMDYQILTDDYKAQIDWCREYVGKQSKPVALVVRKNQFAGSREAQAGEGGFSLSREEALGLLLDHITDDDLVVATTGKTSRELYELRESRGQGHAGDFLSVGAMGHTASLAAGISLGTAQNVYCVDGDGSFLMHMGNMGVITRHVKANFKYILINNGAHESVGGQPTVGFAVGMEQILAGCGFEQVLSADSAEAFSLALQRQQEQPGTAVIVLVKVGSRASLGRPAGSPGEWKQLFTERLKGETG